MLGVAACWAWLPVGVAVCGRGSVLGVVLQAEEVLIELSTLPWNTQRGDLLHGARDLAGLASDRHFILSTVSVLLLCVWCGLQVLSSRVVRDHKMYC